MIEHVWTQQELRFWTMVRLELFVESLIDSNFWSPATYSLYGICELLYKCCDEEFKTLRWTYEFQVMIFSKLVELGVGYSIPFLKKPRQDLVQCISDMNEFRHRKRLYIWH